MEPEEIAVVLTRASELHSKLSDAISFAVEESPSSSSRLTVLPNGDGSSELRSLAAIRDSLEVLEEQLESLQALQQQQRADRDAGLAEIEESRRLFLKRLEDYRGRELEVVQEALAFAGGNVPDKDELPSQSYPPLEDGESPLVSIPRGREDFHEEQRSRNQVFGFEVEEAQEDDGSEVDSTFEDEDYRNSDNLIRTAVKSVNAMKYSVMSSRAFAFVFNVVKSSVSFLRRFAGQISGQVTGPPSKVVLVVVSTFVVLSLTDLGERRTKSVARVSRMPAHRSHQHHNSNANGERGPHMTSSKFYHHVKDPGSMPAEGSEVRKEEDDFPRCVVRERLELPFYQELRSPDVLYGRG
ncbi:hypothetical protein GOP47_0025708 [Adiantum capillus-veneris]|uniref:Uncharacterized protein n=1 Tax=Adiantum capillus-veneris TaxID=13818 RepID=A0A9D4U0T6_ADICA|nr:hypothetical protein GOP47_0025708 [Adiantum capillus-veneris]